MIGDGNGRPNPIRAPVNAETPKHTPVKMLFKTMNRWLVQTE